MVNIDPELKQELLTAAQTFNAQLPSEIPPITINVAPPEPPVIIVNAPEIPPVIVNVAEIPPITVELDPDFQREVLEAVRKFIDQPEDKEVVLCRREGAWTLCRQQ